MNNKDNPNRVTCPKCGKQGTKQARMIKCGKPNCIRLHGPYYYVAHRVGDKVRSCYIGKTWPLG